MTINFVLCFDRLSLCFGPLRVVSNKGHQTLFLPSNKDAVQTTSFQKTAMAYNGKQIASVPILRAKSVCQRWRWTALYARDVRGKKCGLRVDRPERRLVDGSLRVRRPDGVVRVTSVPFSATNGRAGEFRLFIDARTCRFERSRRNVSMQRAVLF